MKKCFFQTVLSIICAMNLTTSFALTHWKSMNLDFSDLYAIAVDPRDENTIYAGGESSTLYKSINGGESWQLISYTRVSQFITSIIPSPGQPNTLYISDPGAIYKTEDGGKTWRKLTSSLPSYVESFVFNPENTNDIIVVTGEGDFYESIDGGNEWQLVQNGPAKPSNANVGYHITINPHNGNDLALITLTDTNDVERTCVLRRSIDHGKTWQPLLTLQNESMRSVSYANDDANILYLTTMNALYRSMDGGLSWKVIKSFTAEDIEKIFSPSHSPEMIYLVSNNEQTHQRNLWMSKDRGTTWTMQNANIPFKSYFFPFAVSSNNPHKLYAAMDSGFAISTDDGKNWHINYEGLKHTYCCDPIMMYSAPGSSLLLAKTSYTLWRSFDGKRWEKITLPLDARIEEVAIQPHSSSRLLLSMGIDYDENDHGMYYSDDAGNTWKKANISGSHFFRADSIKYHPLNPMQIIASNDYGKDVIISKDGGKTWHAAIVTNDNQSDESKFAINPFNPDEIYLLSGLYRKLFKSYHFGESWTPFPQKKDAPELDDIYFDPKQSKVMYATHSYPHNDSAIFKSVDGGITWKPYGNLSAENYRASIVFDPDHADTWYIIEDGIYVSTDNGATWAKEENDLPQHAGFGSLTWYQHKLIVGTESAGVFMREE